MPLTVQKVDAGTSSVFAPKHTARELDTLPFRAAIWDPLAVYWCVLVALGTTDLLCKSTTSDLSKSRVRNRT